MRSFARVAALALFTALGLPVTGIAQDLIPPSRMVVAKDQRCSVMGQCTLHHLTRINTGAVDRTTKQ